MPSNKQRPRGGSALVGWISRALHSRFKTKRDFYKWALAAFVAAWLLSAALGAGFVALDGWVTGLVETAPTETGANL